MNQHTADLLGRRVGRHTLETLIGEGAFTWVFLARDTPTDAPVALKVLKPRYSGDPGFAQRFLAESELASRLAHPNVVRILDIGQSEHLTYFAMELFPDSLASLTSREGPLEEARLVDIGIQVAAGLAYAHWRGIVHRDIKGDNILLAEDGRAVISDFGTARAVSDYLNHAGRGMTLGTPHYISPEQAHGDLLDGRSDIYSLGATLYQAATGDVPFRSTDWYELARMITEDPPEPPRKVRPDLSPRLQKIILRCLAKRPQGRHQTADQLGAALSRISPDAVGTRPRAGRIRRWGTVAILILAATVVAILWFGS